ncbi:hypothetical protein ANO11243_071180 [Dothideomycetidae sp. 11243]|nr:hypothetical protein ANO11243_071180 [fungal sp. No.11243]
MSGSSAAPTYVLWHYTPSLPANVVVAVVFAVLGMAHAIRLFQKRLRFCIPLFIGAIFEIVGYGCRVWAHSNLKSTMPYAIQSLLTLLAPILFAASVYMFLGRIIRAADGEAASPIRARWLTKTFVCGDILCFFVQGGGGGILIGAKTQKTVNLGEYVILGGLVLQIVIFLFFIAVAVVWHKRMSSLSRTTANVAIERFDWQRYIFSLYTVSILIAVRNIVRCIEFDMGSSGYLLSHEWTTLVFDALLMALVLAISWFWHGSGIANLQQKQSFDRQSSDITLTTKH